MNNYWIFKITYFLFITFGLIKLRTFVKKFYLQKLRFNKYLGNKYMKICIKLLLEKFQKKFLIKSCNELF